MIGVCAAVVKAYAPKDRQLRPTNGLRVDIGRRLADLRGQMTQRELARRADVDPGTVSRIERGELDPTYSTLLKLAKGLGAEAALFFAPASSNQPVARAEMVTRLEDVEEDVGTIHQLSDLNRVAMREMLDVLLVLETVPRPQKERLQRVREQLR